MRAIERLRDPIRLAWALQQLPPTSLTHVNKAGRVFIANSQHRLCCAYSCMGVGPAFVAFFFFVLGLQPINGRVP